MVQNKNSIKILMYVFAKALGSSPAVFSSPDQTEIPAVQAHILALGAEKMHSDLRVRYEKLRAVLNGKR